MAAVFIAFLIPFLDVGIGHSPTLRGEPAGWVTYLPGYGGYRVLIDGGLTTGFDETSGLLLALAWIVVLALLPSCSSDAPSDPRADVQPQRARKGKPASLTFAGGRGVLQPPAG